MWTDRFSIRATCASFSVLLALVLSCSVTRAQETSALTLDSHLSSDRTTSLLSDNFSVSITLDLPPEDASALFAGNSIGYQRRSVASIGHLADPAAVNYKFVLFRKAVQPGLGSLTWGNLQAGYGRVFYDESVISRGSNGTAWEEPGCLYLKTRFRF